MQSNSLALWRRELDPTPILNYPVRRPVSTLMGVVDKLGAVQGYLSMFNTDHAEHGLAVANLAVGYAFSILSHLGLEDDNGPTPPIRNLKMARLAIKNLRAVVRSHFEAWQRAAKDDEAEAIRAQSESEIVAPTEDEADAAPTQDLVIARTQPKIEISRWAELGIGIGVDKYYGFPKCPERGQRVRLKDANILPLVGVRWRKVLECLAVSRDGKTTAKAELVQHLHPIRRGGISEEQAVFDEGMQGKAKNALTTLRHTMADLGRELRGLVTTADPTKVFQSNGDDYLAAFSTRHLFRDSDGNFFFGRAQ